MNNNKNTVVRARINEHIKEEAAVVLKAIELTVSDAFRLLLTKVAREKKLPFEPLIPNKETIAAIKAAHAGTLNTIGDINDFNKLLDELDAKN